MAVYYKFKSAKEFDRITIESPFVDVAYIKQRIFESKRYGHGRDFDIIVSYAAPADGDQSSQQDLSEETLIARNSSLIVRRVPGLPRQTIVVPPEKPKVESKESEDVQTVQTNSTAAGSSAWDVVDYSFLDDPFDAPEVTQQQPVDAAAARKAEEDSKIKALVENSALDWQHQTNEHCETGRGFGKGGRGLGQGGFQSRTPPKGYVCHRCNAPGHFIQHCPTNGDPAYDIKRVKPPTGIPKSMLVPTPDGSYVSSTGTAAILKPDEASFDKEMQGLQSSSSADNIPPELLCPLCKQVMKDAVVIKCCFQSFCDKCIRDFIISKSMCFCGAQNVLADDLIPNKTLRDTINRILESGNRSSDNSDSANQVTQPVKPLPAQSASSRGGLTPPPLSENTSNLKENIDGERLSDPSEGIIQPKALSKGTLAEVPNVPEVTLESERALASTSMSGAQTVAKKAQQKVASHELSKKTRNNEVPMLANPTNMQYMDMPQAGMNGHMSPFFNPYWQGMQPSFDGYSSAYGPQFGVESMYNQFPNVMPQYHYGPQFAMYPPPQRPALTSKKEFQSQNDDARRANNDEVRRAPSRAHNDRDQRESDRDRQRSRKTVTVEQGGHCQTSCNRLSKPTSPDHSHRHADAPRPSLKRKLHQYEGNHEDDHVHGHDHKRDGHRKRGHGREYEKEQKRCHSRQSESLKVGHSASTLEVV